MGLARRCAAIIAECYIAEGQLHPRVVPSRQARRRFRCGTVSSCLAMTPLRSHASLLLSPVGRFPGRSCGQTLCSHKSIGSRLPLRQRWQPCARQSVP